MKKLTTLIAGFFLLFFLSAFTPGNANVSARIIAVFEDNFSPTSEVKWTKHEDIYVASFKENGKSLTAAYNAEGDLLVTGKYVSLEQLPVKAAKILADKYAGYSIVNTVVELTTDVTWYLVDVQNDKVKLRLRCDESGITVESKTKK